MRTIDRGLLALLGTLVLGCGLATCLGGCKDFATPAETNQCVRFGDTVGLCNVENGQTYICGAAGCMPLVARPFPNPPACTGSAPQPEKPTGEESQR